MELNNIKIAGSGIIASGEYNNISIAGSSKSNGDIICQVLKVAGRSSFDGNVEAKELSIAGSTNFLKNLKCNVIKISGSVKVFENLLSEELKVDGKIIVNGECNVGSLLHEGGGSKYNNIYGETIKLFGSRKSLILAHEIEATNIELKNVKVKRVSGDNLKIEGKCEIDIIEYRNTLKISKNVVVKEIVKL